MIHVRFSSHAQQRFQERKISLDEIMDAINDPGVTCAANQPGRLKFISRHGSSGQRIMVVSSWPPDANDTVVLITCYRATAQDGQ